MTLKYMGGDGVLRTLTALSVIDAGKTTRALYSVKQMGADGLIRTIATFAPPLLVTVSPSTNESYGFTKTTGYSIATPVGGRGPYTYSWTRTAGTAVANTPTNAQTTFTDAGATANALRESDFILTVTDAFGRTATASVTVSIEYVPLEIGGLF